MSQHPHTIVCATGKDTAGTDGAYVARAGALVGFGATPLDAIRDLLDNEDHARRVLSTVYGTPGQ